MGIFIGLEDISFEYPTKPLFKNVTLGVDEGSRIGIVGRNGDGKSTLLRILGGRLEPDAGNITMRRGISVGMLGQADSLLDSATVEEAVFDGAARHEWASDARVRAIVSALMGDIALDSCVGTLSGGQRRRVDLARLLIGQWDVLLLDEPTNHLDMRAIRWLAQHLNSRWAPGAGCLLVVTHDRWFLDEVCLRMWEVHDGVVEPFEGGYSAYILQRVERDRQAQASEERRRNIARKELAWLSRGAQARSTKPKFRVEAARALIADVPPLRNELVLRQLSVSRLGKQVLELDDAVLSFGGRRVLDGVSWNIGPGDRFGLLGANGAGKSTLLRVLQGLQPLDAGRLKTGSTVKIAVLSQRLDELMAHAGETVRSVLSDYKSYYKLDGKEYTPAQMLGNLGFDTSELWTRVEELSGGQKRRLQLLLVLLQEPNVLILDEPGNDMDTDMLAIMEDLLDSWPGTLVLVTHDRYLMERVTDMQYALIDGHLRHCPRGVDEFLQLLDDKSAPGAALPSARHSSGQESYQLKKRLAAVERKMEKLGQELEQIQADMLAVDPSDFEKLGALQKEVDTRTQELEELEGSWLELTEALDA